MKTLLHLKISPKATCVLVFLWFLVLFITYLVCIYLAVHEIKDNPASRILIPCAGGYILHKKTGARVMRFLKTKVFVRR